MLKIVDEGFQKRFQLSNQLQFNDIKNRIIGLANNYEISVNISKEQVKIRNWNYGTYRRSNCCA